MASRKREKTGLSQAVFARLLGFQFGRCKSGNRVGVPPLAQLAHCCLLQQTPHEI
jgi:hypothetical protein